VQRMPDVSAIDRGGGKGRGQSAGLTGNEAGCRGRHTTTERGLIEAQSRTGHPAGPSAADAEQLERREHFAVDLPAVRQRVGSPAQVASSALTQPSAFPSITRFEDGNWSGFASLVNRSTSALSPLATTGRGLRRNSACAFGKSAKLENAAFSWALGPCRCRRACRAATRGGLGPRRGGHRLFSLSLQVRDEHLEAATGAARCWGHNGGSHRCTTSARCPTAAPSSPGCCSCAAIRASSAKRRAVPEPGANLSCSTLTATSRPRAESMAR
jgi:hypothetical protein